MKAKVAQFANLFKPKMPSEVSQESFNDPPAVDMHIPKQDAPVAEIKSIEFVNSQMSKVKTVKAKKLPYYL